MKYRATQPNFSRGELAPELYGRFDVDAWQSSLQQARNVIILKFGGITKRPGTRLVSEVLDASEPNRIIPFQFSLTQTYALEMGQAYMAPCAFGGRVLEEELDITGVTSAANAQITAIYHGYSVGNYVWIDGIDGEIGDLLNSRKWRVVSVVDADNFTIDADTTGLAAFTAADGGITRVGPPAADPTPPTVPPVVPPPADPPVGGGGGGKFTPAGPDEVNQ